LQKLQNISFRPRNENSCKRPLISEVLPKGYFWVIFQTHHLTAVLFLTNQVPSSSGTFPLLLGPWDNSWLKKKQMHHVKVVIQE